MASTIAPTTTYAPPSTPAFDPSKIDVHAPDYARDPYATYAQCRRSAPLTLVKLCDDERYWSTWVFRHADVVAALNDQATFVKNPPGGAPRSPYIFGVKDALPPGVFSADPPAHAAIRGAFEPPLRAAFANAPDVANALVAASLGALRKSGTRRFEPMAEYALAIPSGTLFTLLGIKQTYWPSLVGMVRAVAATNDPTQPMGVQVGGGTSMLALYFYCQTLVLEAERGAEDTVLKQMLTRGLDAGLTREHLQSTLLNLLIAGWLSTTFLIGSGVLNLLSNPSQLALLRADPSRIDAAVQEMLRYDAPAQLVDRVVAADTTLGGVELKAGDKVTLVLGSANHDEDVFERAGEFDITRTDVMKAVPFGGGIHVCIGAPLVTRVAPIAIGRVVAELPDLALAGIVQWQTDPYLRSPSNLPLAV